MTRRLELSDFRAQRTVLEPSDFALGGDEPDPPPADLIGKGVWLSITTLPDDVAIRTSNHHGTALGKMHDLWAAIVEAVAVENQDAFDAALLDAADDFQGAVYNALCGYYRLSFSSLRSVVELAAVGAYSQICTKSSDYEKWRQGKVILKFDTVCSRVNASGQLSELRDHLRSKVSDSLFDQRSPDSDAGWARRLYRKLSNYAHARPGHTDGDLRESNGPIYVPGAFIEAARMHLEVAALVFILLRLARKEFVLPEGGEEVFLDGHPAVPQIASEAWRKLHEPS